ncbi:hypothetical protein BKH41_01905 [Helicobacter sp. 12S02232-10]|uniref:hypothetical protein n=1 Tax=Helicobacter sp. 12S02232-10 TaxID=1476197 RepID=UPI000BA79F47|nr:hypothetical protein [Helicobacter sp. 12S02232-10]PAF49443.1 hypothetical protein BKH41_01905 [Helicobacter sp. 12S02232-10]
MNEKRIDKMSEKITKTEFEILSTDKIKSDYKVGMSIDENICSLAELTQNHILADLEKLADKHPEMFDKPSDVFRLIRKVLENPTHFYRNNRLDASLIVKYMQENKIGKVVITKETGEVIHATKVDERDLKRLEKRSNEKTGSADIIQTFTQLGSKQEDTRLRLPKENIDVILPKNNECDNNRQICKSKPKSKKWDREI